MKKKHLDLPTVRRVENPDWLPIFQAKKALPPNVQTHRMGQCYILLIPPQGEFLYRMTIACKDRYPTFDEVWKAWHDLVPDAKTTNAVMMLPDQVAYDHPNNFGLSVQQIVPAQVTSNAL